VPRSRMTRGESSAARPIHGEPTIATRGTSAKSTTVVRRRARGPVAIGHEDDGRLRLTLGDRRLLLPGALEPAVRRLLDGAARPVAELADLLDADSRRVLVRRLVREGVLRTAARAGTAGG